MDLSEAVEWWQEWQLQVLVLASLSIQWFLFVCAPLRKRRIPALLRFFIWLAYLGSDAVAIYALANLFSRQKKKEGNHGPQVLWVPILLVHLGGQEAITAYNIEDNELWRRHVLTAASQVTVAIYVFGKYFLWSNLIQRKYYPWKRSSSEDEGIFEAGLLLFLTGITKCLFKPWDLKRVSMHSLVDSSGSEEKGEVDSLHEYVRAATQYFQAGHGDVPPSGGEDICKVDEVWKHYNLCVDLAPLYSGRLSCLRHLVRSEGDAHRLVQSGLSAMFDRLYTKESLKLHDITSLAYISRWTILTSAVGIRTVAAATLVWATALFHGASEGDGGADATITNALLWSAAVIECVVPVVMDSFDGIKQWRLSEKRWPDDVAQYNLMGYLARNTKHSWLMKTAGYLDCRDLLDQRWSMESAKSSHEITKLVHGHIARGWTEGHLADAEAFRAFNDSRGRWTLDKEGAGTMRLRSSVSRPFDESVLLWHLATDFCFHTAQAPSSDAARHCREISNYMVYLLFVNPEMLMPGARRKLFRDTYSELAELVKEHRRTPRDERGLSHKVIQLVKSETQGSGIIHEAWSVAEELMEKHERRMWVVIRGVWVEMLCFSAGRCRGYLHAKSLSTGGEYLSYVWLLLLYMGMENFSEKMQRTELCEDSTPTADHNV